MNPEMLLDEEGWDDTPVVDFHIHCPGEVGGSPPNPKLQALRAKLNEEIPREHRRTFFKDIQDPLFLRDHLKSQGVSYGVILADYAPVATGTIANEDVGKFCQDVPELIPFACMNPYIHYDLPGTLERLVKEHGFKGVKLLPSYQQYYPNDARMYPLYEKIVELGLPVMIHTGVSMFRGTRIKYCDPLLLDDLAVDFPEMKIVMSHSGRGVWYEQAFFMATLHENIYMEITGLPPQNLLTYFPKLDRVLDKVIFGTDFPQIINIRKNIDGIKQLPFPRQEIKKILGLNALKVMPPLGNGSLSSA